MKEPMRISHMNAYIREVCMKYLKNPEQYFDLKHNYDSPNRYYHDWTHIMHVVHKLINEPNSDLLIIAAFLHDIVYDTHSTTNEEDSAAFVDLFDLTEYDNKLLKDLILFTKYDRMPKNGMESVFMDADLDIFNQSHTTQLAFEDAIFKEYHWVSIPVYVEKRIEILKRLKNDYGCTTDYLVNYLQTKKWKVGFYLGTFYPFTIGHKSILEQAERLFDKVIIGFGNPMNKTSFEWDEKAYGILNEWVRSNYECVSLKALVTDNIDDIAEYASSITLIRGLRNSSDLTYEQNYLETLRDMYPAQMRDTKRITAAYFMTDPDKAHISSSLVRELLKLSPEKAYNYYKI